MTHADTDTLADRAAIAELSYRYSLAVDTKQFDELDTVFTADAVIDYTDMGGIKGSYPEVKQWLTDTLAYFKGMLHITTNQIITIDGDSASARSICLAPMTLALLGHPERVQFYGLWYHDTYQHTAQGWRISSRREEKVLDHNV